MKVAQAGTLESGDILVRITPSQESGLEINLDSTVAYQFGAQIKKVIADTLGELGVTGVRATGCDVWKDYVILDPPNRQINLKSNQKCKDSEEQ